jgi:AcrR family transcriptional regulator
MPPNDRTRTAARDPLNRERVLRAAVRLADAEGFEALTMRGLADALGVKAMSLYNHVANKDDIASGIVDLVLSEVELPVPGGRDWKTQLRRTAISAHRVLLSHRWAGRLATPGPTPARLRWMDAVLATLRQAGFSTALTDLAYHTLDSHITGSTLWRTSMPFRDEAELVEIARQTLRSPFIEELPYFAEHVQHHAEPRPDKPDTFEFGLDLILDGIERLRRSRRTA